MKKRRLVSVGSAFGLVVVGLLLVPASRSTILGLVRQEHFEEGRPMSYWVSELHDRDNSRRWEAATMLGQMGPDGRDSALALAEALHDADDHVRVNAALALVKIGPAATVAVPALGEALGDEVAFVRMDAAIALNRMGANARPAVPALVRALQDQQNRRPIFSFGTSVWRIASRALGHIGPDAKEAIPVLTQMLQEDDPELRQEVAQALRRIDPEAADRILGEHSHKTPSKAGS